MKLLVFGRTGQVARELARRCPAGVELRQLGRAEADLSDPAACAARIAAAPVDAVINAAAWTAVDRAEEEEEAATAINALAPGAMATACAERAIPFLHLSTDYVFDGSGTEPFHPQDPTRPINAYGRSKLAGENAIRAAGGQHLILRTSWVVSVHGHNFVKTMLRLGREREAVTVVADQVGGLTPAAALADALIHCARALCEGMPGGTFHLTGTPDASWAEIAREVMTVAGLECSVREIATEDYPTPAPRPLNSRLDCRSFEEAFGIVRPQWRSALREIVKELEANR